MSVGHTVGAIWSSNLGFGHNLSDDAIWTTRLLIICTISSQGAKINTLTSFSYDSLIGGCISVKCQLLTVNFVGFGCQPGFRLDTSGQSLWQSYTQIQAVLVIFFSLALASQPFVWNHGICNRYGLSAKKPPLKNTWSFYRYRMDALKLMAVGASFEGPQMCVLLIWLTKYCSGTIALWSFDAYEWLALILMEVARC